MALLRIVLRHGFQDDFVTLRVNGAEVFSKPKVRTRYQIDQADSLEMDVNQNRTEVEIALPQRNLRESVFVNTSSPVALAFSLTESGHIEHSFPDVRHGDL